MVYMIQYYSVIKKNEILHLQQHGWTLEAIMLSEISETEKGKYVISLIFVIQRTKQMNKQPSHGYTEQTYECQRKGGWWGG